MSLFIYFSICETYCTLSPRQSRDHFDAQKRSPATHDREAGDFLQFYDWCLSPSWFQRAFTHHEQNMQQKILGINGMNYTR